MRAIAVDMDAEALVVALQAVAKPTDIGKRNQMIGLAEHPEHRAGNRTDDVVERARIFSTDRPFARLRGAVPDQRGGDRAGRGDHQGQPAGLAHPHDGDPRRVGLRDRRQRVDHGAERYRGLGVAHVAIGVAAVERLLVGVAEVKVRRDGGIAGAGEPLREVAGVLHEAVAFMHHDHGGYLCGALGHRHEGRHVPERRRPAAHAGHSFAASPRKLASMKPASGGGVVISPSATSASKLAAMPSGESAASRAMTSKRGIKVIRGGGDPRRGPRGLDQDGDDLVAVGRIVEKPRRPDARPQ